MNAALGAAARAARQARLERPLALARDAGDALFLRLRRPPLSATDGSVTLRGFLRHRSFLAELERGGYEPTLRSALLGALEPGCTFVDGGAHLGLYSLLAARAGAAVIAVEPDPYNRAALKLNVAGAGVAVVGRALSDADGVTTFHPSASTTGSSLLPRTDIRMRRPVAVETTTVDALLAGRDLELLVLKLDVEGAEAAALAGARESLRRAARAVVFAEVNPRALASVGAGPAAIVEPLQALGFSLRFAGRSGELGELPAEPTKGNLVASRLGSS